MEENLRIHLQAVRLGEVLLVSCSCEAQVDLIKNLESRTDDVGGNIYDGFAWEDYCNKAAAPWKCADPGKQNLNDRSLTVTDAAYKRMVAQVHNDAKGWDDPANAATANGEPVDPAQIKGNFTKEELPPARGYRLPVGVGHAGDYNGYTVSYRMYLSYDHYRKALTSYGPHTADYMATRLVRMAGELKGGPALPPEPLDALGHARRRPAAGERRRARSGCRRRLPRLDPHLARRRHRRPVRRAAEEHRPLPAPAPPGSAATTTPTIPPCASSAYEDGRWRTYADQTGEVQARVDLPKGLTSVLTSSRAVPMDLDGELRGGRLLPT